MRKKGIKKHDKSYSIQTILKGKEERMVRKTHGLVGFGHCGVS